MTSEQFLQEVLSSAICPDDFESIFREFQHYQQAAIETLNEFHRVCEKFNIRYQLAYGSLLGAIRDNGQIPWDYDVDVFVPYEERLKLIDALKTDLDGRYYFYCPEIDPQCRHFFIRLAPVGYRTTALHVDVFYVVGAPEDDEKRDLFAKSIIKYFHLRYTKLVKINEESQGSFKRKIMLFLMRLKSMTLPLSKVEEKYYELCTRYDFDKSKYSVAANSLCDKKTFLTEKMWETELIDTSIGKFRIPKNYDEVLTSIYGDYNKIFPLQNRLNEMLGYYKRLKYFDKDK